MSISDSNEIISDKTYLKTPTAYSVQSYDGNLTAAIRRSAEWGVVSSQEASHLQSIIVNAPIYERRSDIQASYLPAARRIIRDLHRRSRLGPERIRGECAAVHLSLSGNFDIANLQHILTIGDVIYQGEAEWKTDLGYLRDEIDGKFKRGDALRCHAWITLPDLRILDATYWFRLHRVPLPKKFRWEDRIICDAPTRPDIEYVPLLVGSGFLQKILQAA